MTLLEEFVVTVPLPSVCGEEVVVALRRAGFTVVKRTPEGSVLSHGHRDVVVPFGPVGEDVLRALLRTAGLAYSEFLDMLESIDPAYDSQVRTRVT